MKIFSIVVQVEYEGIEAGNLDDACDRAESMIRNAHLGVAKISSHGVEITEE